MQMSRGDFFGGNGNVPYLDCGGGYISICISQDSMNCILKTDACM